MNMLEKSVSNLAEALENLESRLDTRLESGEFERDNALSVQRQARVAHEQTKQASNHLGSAISDLKNLLANHPEKSA